jgi:hypothetical protein
LNICEDIKEALRRARRIHRTRLAIEVRKRAPGRTA